LKEREKEDRNGGKRRIRRKKLLGDLKARRRYCTLKTKRQIQLSAELALEDDFDLCNKEYVLMISEVIVKVSWFLVLFTVVFFAFGYKKKIPYMCLNLDTLSAGCSNFLITQSDSTSEPRNCSE
jgi:hypothetical protein